MYQFGTFVDENVSDTIPLHNELISICPVDNYLSLPITQALFVYSTMITIYNAVLFTRTMDHVTSFMFDLTILPTHTFFNKNNLTIIVPFRLWE